MPVQEPAGGSFQPVHSVAFDVEVVLLPAFKPAFEFHDGVTLLGERTAAEAARWQTMT